WNGANRSNTNRERKAGRWETHHDVFHDRRLHSGDPDGACWRAVSRGHSMRVALQEQRAQGVRRARGCAGRVSARRGIARADMTAREFPRAPESLLQILAEER